MVKGLVLILIVATLVSCEPATKNRSMQSINTDSGEPVEQNRPITFPRDHGPHLEQGIEWWYVTANLTAKTGETFGAQWTLFRTLAPLPFKSAWWDNQLYFAHFALQHEQTHVAFERFGRKGQANIDGHPFRAYLDDWSLTSHSVEQALFPLQMTAKEGSYAMDIALDNSPLVLHGDAGYSQKTQSGHASYYFSYPFLEANGTLTYQGKQYHVSGNAWYDREWSASLLDKTQRGWDWFSIVSDENPKQGLMLFCIRDARQYYDYCSGTRIDQQGNATLIEHDAISLLPLDFITIGGKRYPHKWQVNLQDSSPIVIETVTKDSINRLAIEYWEGRIISTGGFNGRGYAELLGY
ncbi:AttH component of AttEFGH ABC transport system [Pseudoalteromonas luteoviolacea B = ATCC 29581]|nr:AttH component of AttEFGH ABC transport system [Pseudoalteromonas luteoviolacea B = ATCC 29581]